MCLELDFRNIRVFEICKRFDAALTTLPAGIPCFFMRNRRRSVVRPFAVLLGPRVLGLGGLKVPIMIKL